MSVLTPGAAMRRTLPSPALPWVAVAALTALSGLIGAVAADSRWLAALGGEIVQRGHIPDGVPYATADSQGWPNVPVLGELTFHALESVAGDRGLLIAQVLAVALTLVLLLFDMRLAGAGDRGAFIALILLAPACFTSLVAIRSQLFSLPLFALVLLILRSERRGGSLRVLLLVPLLALWSNLHGAVLTGLAVTGAYLIVSRARREPGLAIATLVASAVAILATPALWRTPDYYRGVLANQAAKQGIGLWRPLDLGAPLDLVFVAAAVVLVALALRARPPLWEIVMLVGLAVLTLQAARGGVWLALAAATPAAVGAQGPESSRPRLAGPVAIALALAALGGIVRGPLNTAASSRVLHSALVSAGGTPVLAEDQLAEQLVLAGGRVWIGNPLDAFRADDQRVYVDWLRGRPAGDRALEQAPRVVIVKPGTAAARRISRDPAFVAGPHDRFAAIYRRR